MAAKNLKRVMFSTGQHDALFLREMLSAKPYNYPKGSKDSVAAWWAAVEKTLTDVRIPHILLIQNL